MQLPVKSRSKKETLSPWIEKYRPKVIDDIIYQDDVVSVLKRYVELGNLPNSLFYGPPGTGKTSAILTVARQLFGSEYTNRVLELNASDERGINVIRAKVKKFSRLAVPNDTFINNRRVPPIKLIILDEADSMTSSAQAALRRIMEKEIKTTRFCIICNYISRIIDPLASRCTKFRFKALPTDLVHYQLDQICQCEGITIEKDAISTVIYGSQGDLRKAIMYLHTASLFVPNNIITANDMLEICGIIPNDVLLALVNSTKSKVNNMIDQVKLFLREGYSSSRLLNMLLQWVIECDQISDVSKSVILEQISLCEQNLNDGASEVLQLTTLFSKIMEIQ